MAGNSTSDHKETGFGLARSVREGYCSCFNQPELSWKPLKEEFEIYFKEKYPLSWYLKPFLPILKKVAIAAWGKALQEHAKQEETTTKELNK